MFNLSKERNTLSTFTGSYDSLHINADKYSEHKTYLKLNKLICLFISFILSFVLLGTSFFNMQSAFAETKTEEISGVLTLQLQKTVTPEDPNNPENSNSGSEINSGNETDNNTNAIKAESMSKKSSLFNTGDGLFLILVACLISCGAIGGFVLYKKRAFVNASSNSVHGLHVRNSYQTSTLNRIQNFSSARRRKMGNLKGKHTATNKTNGFRILKKVFLIILSAFLVTSLGLGLVNVIKASADEQSQIADVSAKIIVNEKGEIISASATFNNNLPTKATVLSLTLGDAFKDFSLDLAENNEVDAGGLLNKNLNYDIDKIGDNLLSDLANNSGMLEFDLTSEIAYEVFTVKWHLNDDADTIYSESKVVENGEAKLPDTTADLKKDNYDFVEWNNAQNGNGETVNEEFLTENPVVADTDYYAKWTPKTYTITYDLNDGSLAQGITNPAQYVYGTGIAGFESPIKMGWTFAGWFDAEGNKFALISATQSGDLVLQAKYTANTNTAYTVKHYLENIDNDLYTLNDTQSLTGTTAAETQAVANTKTGFTALQFEQKTIEGDGSTVVEIYYNRNKYEVSFNANGHGLAPDAQSIKYEGRATKPASLSEEGMTFGGWYSNQGCTGNEFDFANQKIYDATTLYAKWTFNEYQITYDLGGGALSQDVSNPSKYTFGTGVTSFASPSKVGYTFDGWYNASGDKVTEISTSEIGDISLSARYVPNSDTKYEVRHYVEDLESGEYRLKERTTYRGTTGTKTQAHGMASFSQFGTMLDFEQQDIAADGSTVIKIYYNLNKYDITFNLNGHGTGLPDKQTIKHGGKAIKPTSPTDASLMFGGWFEQKSCTGNEFDFDNNQITTSITLYAKWISGYQITFNLNAPTGETCQWADGTTTDKVALAMPSDFKIVLPDGVTGSPNCSSNATYVLAGWYDAKTGGNQIAIGTSVATENMILYAHWTKDVFLAKVDGTNFDPTNLSTYGNADITSIVDVKAAATTIASGGTNPDPAKYNATNDQYHLFARIGGSATSTTANDWLECRIIHVGQHDNDGSGLAFQAVHAWSTRYKWDTNWSNGQAPNWSNSTLRTTMNSTIYNTLPDLLKTNIKQITKKSNATAGSNPNGGNTVITSDKLWIISYTELCRNSTSSKWWNDASHDGSVYQFWSSKNLSIDTKAFSDTTQQQLLYKLNCDRSGTLLKESSWANGYSWQRSVDPYYSFCALRFYSDGCVYSNDGEYPPNEYCVAPSFAM